MARVLFSVVMLLFWASLAPALHGEGLSLSVEVPQEMLYVGRPFDFDARLSWHGSSDLWIVKDIEGPSLNGLRELGHSLTARVVADSEGERSLQHHRFRLIADEEGRVRISPLEFTLLGKGGEKRVLKSKALTIEIHDSLWNSFLQVPGKTRISALVGGFIVLGFAFLTWRKRRREFQEKIRKEKLEQVRKEREELERPLQEMVDSLGDDECKEFYAKAKEVVIAVLKRKGVELSSEGEASILEGLGHLDLEKTKVKGLEKLIKDADLVRFAGLRPDRRERENVVSRVEELADTEFHKSDEDD